MARVPLVDAAIPALWLFLLGFLLTLGIIRARRARHDVRDDWNRLVRFSQQLTVLEATGGSDETVRVECAALGRALDEFLDPPYESLTLAALVDRFSPHGQPWGVSADDSRATGEALRVRVIQIDRELQRRMKESERAAGHVGRVFLVGIGGVLVAPLEVARACGLLTRLTTRRVEASPWYHASLGIAIFIVVAGSALVAHRLWRLALRVGSELGLGS